MNQAPIRPLTLLWTSAWHCSPWATTAGAGCVPGPQCGQRARLAPHRRLGLLHSTAASWKTRFRPDLGHSRGRLSRGCAAAGVCVCLVPDKQPGIELQIACSEEHAKIDPSPQTIGVNSFGNSRSMIPIGPSGVEEGRPDPRRSRSIQRSSESAAGAARWRA